MITSTLLCVNRIKFSFCINTKYDNHKSKLTVTLLSVLSIFTTISFHVQIFIYIISNFNKIMHIFLII